MNNRLVEEQMLESATAAIETLGLRVHQVGGHGLGPHLEFTRGGAAQIYAVQTRRVVRPSTIALVVDRVQSISDRYPVVLVTEQVSAETAELLRRRGVEFIDTAGNAYLDNPGFLVVISGKRSAATTSNTDGVRVGNAALQVAFVLLRDEDAAGLSVRDLGARAGVSHGAAAAALHAFDARGWVRNLGRSGQPIIDRPGMLAGWLAGFANQLGPKLEITRALAPGTSGPSTWAREVWGELLPGVDLLGGEAAAELAGHDIRGSTASVYVQAWNTATMKRLRLVPVRDGPISVRSAFAPHMEDPNDQRLVDPLLVLADVAAIPDERLDVTRAALMAIVSARVRE